MPLPESKRRYGDLLLHDGARQGSRWYQGRDVPVFDELQLLRSSNFETFELEAHVAAPEHIDHLADLAGEMGLAVEDWTTVQYICAACSKGTVHVHPPSEAEPWQPECRLGVAAKDDSAVKALLEQWCSMTGAVARSSDSPN